MKAIQQWGRAAVGGEDLQPRTLTGLVARQLRRDIITNRLEPGARLAMTDLMQRYNVGSSPIREALFQVANEGLLRNVAHHGFSVAEIDTAEMLDISMLRAELEARAIRLSMEFPDQAWRGRVTAANSALAQTHASISKNNGEGRVEVSDEWEVRHRQLHFALCSNCRSPWLLRFIDILYDHLERYRRYFWNYDERIQGADEEHDEIVRAALSGEADEAISLLKRHFATQAELSLAVNINQQN